MLTVIPICLLPYMPGPRHRSISIGRIITSPGCEIDCEAGLPGDGPVQVKNEGRIVLAYQSMGPWHRKPVLLVFNQSSVRPESLFLLFESALCGVLGQPPLLFRAADSAGTDAAAGWGYQVRVPSARAAVSSAFRSARASRGVPAVTAAASAPMPMSLRPGYPGIVVSFWREVACHVFFVMSNIVTIPPATHVYVNWVKVTASFSTVESSPKPR